MALVLGTNCGFVTVAPTVNPSGTAGTIDTYAYGLKDVAPAGAVTEIGWWCDNATEAANFDVGIYSHDAVNNRPGSLIGSALNNAKGTTSGWKVVSGLNIAITPGTTYWLGVQLDNTATATRTDYATSGGNKQDWKTSQTSLPSPWGVSSGSAGQLLSFYALTGIPTTSLSGTVAATSTVSGNLDLRIATRLSLSGAIAAASSVSGEMRTRQAITPLVRDRAGTYDEDLVWDEDTGTWGSTESLLQAGGSRYHAQLVVVAKDLIYYSEVT